MNEVIETLNKRNDIRVSHELNRASYHLSALALDLLYLFLTEITKEAENFEEFRINFSDLERKLNKQIDRRKIQSAGRELMTTVITLKEEELIKEFTWCSSAEYHTKEHWLSFSIDPKLKSHLLCLKDNYVLGKLSQLVNIKSLYAKRIYMILKQWEKKGSYWVQKTHQSGHPSRFDPATKNARHPATCDGAHPATLAA